MMGITGPRAVLILAAAAAALAAPIDAQTVGPATAAKPVPPVDLIAEFRIRDEFVDQANLPDDAEAFTARARLGVDARITTNLRGLFEVEGVVDFNHRFNSTVNHRTQYPIVSDPQGLEINRAQLTWSGRAAEGVLGRQRIVLGNGRFVGNAGWRQNEQTFDAVRFSASPLKSVTLTYIYIDRVRRTLGPESADGRWNSDSHLLQADAKMPLGQLSGYAYLIDLSSAPAQSSATVGARLAGARPIRPGLEATYAAEYAHQQDYGHAPRRFSLDYLALEGGLKGENWSVATGIERLGGDGRTGFLTPLASFHGFQGWSDAITNTPPDGLLDLHLRATARWRGAPVGDGLRFAAGTYRFTHPDGGRRYGREVDASVATALTDHLGLELKAAFFDGADLALADRTKIWLTGEVTF
ncbi:hypothetical protein [uncultured Sphingomonas sp.]|uniref:hypothetical protein n=1 Tax=uncultured Sphingomonas sp. TaxID=158754 RepID=UPI0035C9FDAE